MVVLSDLGLIQVKQTTGRVPNEHGNILNISKWGIPKLFIFQIDISYIIGIFYFEALPNICCNIIDIINIYIYCSKINWAPSSIYWAGSVYRY